jgi:hypothetical protein
MQRAYEELIDLREAKHFANRIIRFEQKHFGRVNPHHERLKAFIDKRMFAIVCKFDESQPRDANGKWTSGGGGALDNGDTVTGGAGQPIPLADRYRVNLLEEEGGPFNGHTLQKHVGKNPQTMNAEHAASARIEIDPKTGVQELVRTRAESTFRDPISANLYVNDVLLRNANDVDIVASGVYPHNRAFLGNFPTSTGWQSYSDDPADIPILRQVNNVLVVIRHDPLHPRGYRLITAYPRN